MIHPKDLRIMKEELVIPANYVFLKKLDYFSNLFEKLKGSEGSIVECGVGLGVTFLILAFLVQKEGKKRKLWGFDSFAGFPEPSSEDMKTARQPKKGDWSGISSADIEEILRHAGADEEFLKNDVRLVKGFFEDSLAAYDGKPIALLHIDADLYSSYKVVLDKLFSKVVKGGLVLFDEYKDPKWLGATQAIEEFFKADISEFIEDKITGKYYFIKK
jgi:hypothetical protein